MTTRLGDIDCLGALHEGEVYEDLLPHSDLMPLGEGLSLRILRLEKLIEIKRAAGRTKDRAVIPLLEETLAAQRSREKE